MPSQISIRFKPSFGELAKRFDGADLKPFFSEQIAKFAFEIQGKSRRVTPVDTGRLRNSVLIKELSPLRARIGPHTDYDYFVHEGTVKMRARPFMYWGARAAQVPFERSFNKQLDSFLQKRLE